MFLFVVNVKKTGFYFFFFTYSTGTFTVTCFAATLRTKGPLSQLVYLNSIVIIIIIINYFDPLTYDLFVLVESD